MFPTCTDVCFLQLHPPLTFSRRCTSQSSMMKAKVALWPLNPFCCLCQTTDSFSPLVSFDLLFEIFMCFLPLDFYYSHIPFCYFQTLPLNPHNLFCWKWSRSICVLMLRKGVSLLLLNVLYHLVPLTILNKVNDVTKPHNSLQPQHILWTPTVPLLLSVNRNSFSLSLTWGHLAPKPSFFVIILLHPAPPPCFAPSCSASCPLLPYAAPMY